jgi:hypothetical protein
VFSVADARSVEGYPVSPNKKSCARLATYRQCTGQYFEKTPGSLKRKDFMKIFLSSLVEYDGGAGVSNRRADSDPCGDIAKAAALFCAAEANSPGIRFSSTAVARKIRHAITWIVRSALRFLLQCGSGIRGGRADRRRYAR